LPERLFRSTSIPACLWFLARDAGGRRGEVLFIDARAMGTLISRTERVLLPADIAVIAGAYRAWRGGSGGSGGPGGPGGSGGESEAPYADVPGLARSASLAEIRSLDHVLAPGQYVGMPEVAVPAGAEPVTDKVERLTKELLASFDESARLEQAVRGQLTRLAATRPARSSPYPAPDPGRRAGPGEEWAGPGEEWAGPGDGRMGPGEGGAGLGEGRAGPEDG
jgi:type I restriction enzyme M protein